MFAPILPRPIIPICIYPAYGIAATRRATARRQLCPDYCTTTAVPLTVTISMLAFVPTVS